MHSTDKLEDGYFGSGKRLWFSINYHGKDNHVKEIREYLPTGTLRFCAGGNAGGIPIPLVCSPIPDKYKKETNKDIFCSFVGSITHPIRQQMVSILSSNNKYHLSHKQWTDKVINNDMENFMNITSRSIFTLCPRGYGKTSFRLYEVMQLGSIPVFIFDDKWIPFEDEIDWNDFSVLLHINDLSRLDEILSSFTEERINQMQNNLSKYWIENFTMESIFNKILDKI
jgi:hypothetical protein